MYTWGTTTASEARKRVIAGVVAAVFASNSTS
jgi:hypothetical protein